MKKISNLAAASALLLSFAITGSARAATCTTVFVETSSDGKRSDAIAAMTRIGAAVGTDSRCASFVVYSAAATAPATSRIQAPKTVS